MRKVFLEDLPRKGKLNSTFDWANSVGEKVLFVYDDIEGYIDIIGYYKKDDVIYLKLKYNNNEIEMKPGNLVRCKIAVLINKMLRTHIYNVGDRVDNLLIMELLKHKSNVDKGDRAYKYKCLIDGNVGEITEYDLKVGNRCPVCSGNLLMVGYNDFATAFPDMVKYLLYPNDAKLYTKRSNKKIKVKCPDCKHIKEVSVTNLASQGYSCIMCGDGISKPEKIMISLLKQLGITFQPQVSNKKLKWIKGKIRYDFYIPSLNMIIETHGIQHYEESPRGRTLKEEQENDRLKRELAIENGIEHYVELDCRKSDLEFIRYNILNSKLNELFDLTKIDWLKCEEFALKNIIKQVCDYWNNKEEWETTKDLAEKLGLNRTVATTYLNKGVKLGWCNYDPKEENRKSALKSSNLCKKRVKILKGGVLLGLFESVTELSKQSEVLFGIKLDHRSIASVCRGERKQHKGYMFEYADNN